jgi:hypothetical protein
MVTANACAVVMLDEDAATVTTGVVFAGGGFEEEPLPPPPQAAIQKHAMDASHQAAFRPTALIFSLPSRGTGARPFRRNRLRTETPDAVLFRCWSLHHSRE